MAPRSGQLPDGTGEGALRVVGFIVRLPRFIGQAVGAKIKGIR